MNIQTLNLVISFIITIVLGIIIVPKLRQLKIGQVVRKEGPESHLKKSGTPVMGGIIMIITVIAILCFNLVNYKELLIPIVAILGCGIIGFVDDYKKLVKKNTEGLSPKKKILGLLIVTVIVIFLYLKVFNFSTEIIVPLFNQPLYLSTIVFVIFTAFVFIGTTNAVNLTDGLDGLASGVVAIVMTFFTLIAIKNQEKDMIILGASVVGTCLGFLIFNYHPAKVFMGDTGSLALGGAVAVSAIMLKMPLYLLIVAFVCVFDTLSVALQVIYFKLTKGKRIFKMAPFHHHLELCGMKETKVVLLFWSITAALCALAYFI